MMYPAFRWLQDARFTIKLPCFAWRPVKADHTMHCGTRLAGWLAVVAFTALLPGLTLADTMRCGSRIIKEGDMMEKVLDVCGEPTARQRTWIQRPPQFELGGWTYSFPGTEDVPVDTWTYDFGPNKLMQRVRFIAGQVDSIETLGKGTDPY